MLPPNVVLDPLLDQWLREDLGRGDQTVAGLALGQRRGRALWRAKAAGRVAGLPVAQRIFERLEGTVQLECLVAEGDPCSPDLELARLEGPLWALLSGERAALNIAMRLSGIATLTRQFVEQIADLPTTLVDTRKTTPGLRGLEKYAVRVGGGCNHRLGLDDGVMIKENHIAAAGGIGEAIAAVRQRMPYPLTVEVETETLEQVETALQHGADIIMLDNMSLEQMRQAVERIRRHSKAVKIEASGNITLERLRPVALTGVDYISTSAPITRAPWLDLSMRLVEPT